MKTEKQRIPDNGHISEETRRLNPHIYGPAAPQRPASVPHAEKSTKDSGKAPTGVRAGGKMPNKTEQRFLDILEARKRRGEIASVRYEGMSLKWGRDEKTGQAMTYTPDFVVFENHNDRPVMMEVKGAHIYERDLVRFKGARADWPEFSFEMWQWARGEWSKIL